MNIWWQRFKTVMFWIAVGILGVFAIILAFMAVSFLIWALL